MLGGVSDQSLFDNHNTWRPDGTQGDLEERKKAQNVVHSETHTRNFKS